MPSDVTIKDGNIVGGWRRPPNFSEDPEGGIHDDSVAEKLGFGGGLVSGIVLVELFPPVLLKAFGPSWFEHGSISLYFISPLLDRHEARAIIGAPPAGKNDAQVSALIETPDGRKIAEGTAAIGHPDEPSAVYSRRLDRYLPGEVRILAGVKAGDELPEITVTPTRAHVQRRKQGVSDLLDWYGDDWPWGKDMLTPGNLAWSLLLPARSFRTSTLSKEVTAIGAMEVRNINGPVFAERSYRAGGKIVYVGTSPKSEYMYHDTYLEEEGGKRVAEMRMMMRYMKDSSPLWQDKKE